MALDVLPGLVRAYCAGHPGVELDLRELTTAQQVAALNQRDIDIAFGRPPIDDRSLSVETIREESFVVALPDPHPLLEHDVISLEQLQGQPAVMFPRRLGPGLYDRVIAACRHAGLGVEVAQEAIHMQTLVGLVAAGVGFALVPASMQSLRLPGVSYRHLTGAAPTLYLAALRRRDDESPLVHGFLRQAREAGEE